LWDGESIHSAVFNEKIGQITEGEAGFSIAFGRRLSMKGQGVLEVVLADGRKLQRALFSGPLPTLSWIAEQATCTDAAGKTNLAQCGSVISDVGASPYPCCDNTNNGKWTDSGDGNCTWYAWYKAKKLKQWTVPSSWGGGATWCTRAATTAGWKVSSVPAAGTIACGVSVGHVGWVFAVSADKTRINLQEQNCRVSPSCVGTGERSQFYNASSFNYISKN
jgi:surface antigen